MPLRVADPDTLQDTVQGNHMQTDRVVDATWRCLTLAMKCRHICIERTRTTSIAKTVRALHGLVRIAAKKVTATYRVHNIDIDIAASVIVREVGIER